MAVVGYYVVAGNACHEYIQGWNFLTLWDGYGLSEATWEPMSAFIQPDEGTNPIFRSYLAENNEGLLLTRTETLPGQVQDSCRAPVTANVLTPGINRVWHSKHLHIRCLRSTVPAKAVPCGTMLMVTSVNQMAAYQVCCHPASVCLVDHVVHGICPDVMTFGSQQRAVARYSRGE